MSILKGKHILIIVENLPLPFDRRVWQEANSLKENGADVSIICPKMKGYTKSFENINGINIYRHPLPTEANGLLGYLKEYLTALFWEFFLSWKIFFANRFHVIQGCNPPDLIFLVALPFKLFGVKYVFDHHDINPELYIAKFNKKGIFYSLLKMMERMTFASADYSIATNESYKNIAIARGRMNPENVQVVRSGPKLDRLKLGLGNLSYKKGKKYLIGYVGVIGEQEGLDLLLESMKYLIDKKMDVQLAVIGGGTELINIQLLSKKMNLDNHVDFYGRVSDEIMVEILNTSDICVNPDRPTIMNDLSTMNKIMEYMALKKPIVQFDLKEGKFSASSASLYAKNTSTVDFADKIIWLIENPDKRIEMGQFGYNRVINELSWDYESAKYITFYQTVLERKLRYKKQLSYS